MITLWAVCIFIALVHIIAIPFILRGRMDKVIATNELRCQSDMKRLRILMATLSLFAIAFCISVPLVVNQDPDIIIWMAVAFFILVIGIVRMTKTWAKKKND